MLINNNHMKERNGREFKWLLYFKNSLGMDWKDSSSNRRSSF
jgi:hypothetical protein